MKISEKTKISQLIKENPESIQVIASINKHFKKLKNPVLRKLLAPRVSIQDAANIGGTTVEVFFEKLQGLGFEISPFKNSETEKKSSDQKISMEKINQDKLVKLDVMPIIESGEDPFKMILETANKLPVDGAVLIINSFEPIPLINFLGEKGFISKTEKPEEGIVYTYLFKTKKSKEADLTRTEKTELGEFELTATRFGEKIKTIDVRHLEMPEPMVTILQEIENLPKDYALFVHHKRIPQFLIPELKKRDYEILSQKVDSENVHLLIYK